MPKQNVSNASRQSGLASLREASGLTQLQLAVLVGVTPNTIQGWEKHGLPHLRKYRKLASILGCDLSDLDEAEDRGLFDPEELESKFRGNGEPTYRKDMTQEPQSPSSETLSTDRETRKRR